MSTLDRYILNTFIRNLLLVLLVLVALYSLIEFMEKVDNFIEHDAALKYYLLYPLYHLPVRLANALPMAVLLATFATIGGFSRSNQLTAMRGGGLGLARISRPLFLGALALAGLVFIANLWLLPWATRESDYMLRTEIKGNTGKSAATQDLYFRDGSRIISVEHAFPAKSMVLGLTVIEFNENFLPIRRIQAEQARHLQHGQWQLEKAVVWQFDPETRGVSAFERQKEFLLDLKREPAEMLQLWNNPEELAFGELLLLTDKLRTEGYDPRPYQMESQGRIARAAVPLIMVLVGIPFALQRGRNASFALGVVVSLVIFLVYFTLSAIFTVLGAAAILPTFVAAWAANLLMALVGCWLLLRVQG